MVNETLKVIQGQRSWCQIRESTQVYAMKYLQFACYFVVRDQRLWCYMKEDTQVPMNE